MSKYTPGPWMVRRNGYTFVGAAIDAAGTRSIAHATQRDPHPVRGDGITQEQAEANARLIAAAPEYDEGAREFVAYEEAVNRGNDVAAMRHYEAASRILRAAIAKAEGQQ